MKAEAIVYESNTGFTKKYAGLLSEATGLPAYARHEAGASLRKGAAIIYMGWLMAGSVKGLKKASRRYKVKALAAVGMAEPADKSVDDVMDKYKSAAEAVFYLQGGFDLNKLSGIYRFMMNTAVKGSTSNEKEEKTEEQRLALDRMKNGFDAVSPEKLEPIIAWLQ